MESTKSTGVQPSIMETGHILKIDGVLGPTITIPHQLNFQVATDVQSWGWDSLQTTDLILQSFIVEVNHICNHSQKQLFITISNFNQWDYYYYQWEKSGHNCKSVRKWNSLIFISILFQ